MIRDLLHYGALPFLFNQDEGDGAAGGGADAGDQGADNQDSGADDQGDADTGAGDQGAGGDDADADTGAGDQGADNQDSDDAGAGDEESGVWSDKWRESYAGDDQKKLAYLNRFNSPKDLIDKVLEQDKLIRSGGHKKEGLSENPTDEEVAKYREENGIPETADGYLDKLPEGLVLGEDIAEETKPFLEKMHEINASPEFVGSALQQYVDMQAAQAEQIAANDEKLSTDAIVELKTEWGADYQANMQAMHNFLDGYVPSDAREDFEGARLADGTPLFCSPTFISMFSKIQRDINPLGAQTSGTGIDNIDAIEEEIKNLESQMDTKSWYKDEAKQERYRKLIGARDRYKKQA